MASQQTTIRDPRLASATRRLTGGASMADVAAVIHAQAGLIIKLRDALVRDGCEPVDVASDAIVSALWEGLAEAARLKEEGSHQYSLDFLAVLRVADGYGYRWAGACFVRNEAVTIDFPGDDDAVFAVAKAHYDTPLEILMAFEAAGDLDPLEVAAAFKEADIDAIATSSLAIDCSIGERAARKRKAKARAVALVQMDLFSGVIQ